MTNDLKFINLITGEPVEPTGWQLALKVDDYYINESPVAAIGDQVMTDLPNVYGRLVSDEECPPGVFICRAYSQWCPGGELGTINICEATRKLSREEFEAAREAGWP